MPTIYAHCSITALTSYHENAPMNISESFTVGVPVITSNVGGIPYMVTPGKDGFIISPDNPEDIAENLRVLIEDDKLRKIGKNAKNEAERRWKSEIVLRKLEAIAPDVVISQNGRITAALYVV